MAHELEFAFSNEIPQSQHWGLIIFKTPISLCRLPWKRCFLVPGAAAHQLSPPPSFTRQRGRVQDVLGGWDEDVPMPPGHWIATVLTDSA